MAQNFPHGRFRLLKPALSPPERQERPLASLAATTGPKLAQLFAFLYRQGLRSVMEMLFNSYRRGGWLCSTSSSFTQAMFFPAGSAQEDGLLQ